MLGALGMILAVLLALGVGYFSWMNQSPVQVHLWPGMAPRNAFIWEIAGYAAITGCLFSILFVCGQLLGEKRRCRQLRRRVRELEARLPTARTSAVDEAAHAALDNGSPIPAPKIGRTVATRADEEPV